MQTQGPFETGANTQPVNELILFTDNDSELVGIRDHIYKEYGTKGEKVLSNILINSLYYRASNKFYEAFQHDRPVQELIINRTIDEQGEYVKIYINRYGEWCKEQKRLTGIAIPDNRLPPTMLDKK